MAESWRRRPVALVDHGDHALILPLTDPVYQQEPVQLNGAALEVWRRLDESREIDTLVADIAAAHALVAADVRESIVGCLEEFARCGLLDPEPSP